MQSLTENRRGSLRCEHIVAQTRKPQEQHIRKNILTSHVLKRMKVRDVKVTLVERASDMSIINNCDLQKQIPCSIPTAASGLQATAVV